MFLTDIIYFVLHPIYCFSLELIQEYMYTCFAKINRICMPSLHFYCLIKSIDATAEAKSLLETHFDIFETVKISKKVINSYFRSSKVGT